MFQIEEELKKLPAKPGVYLMHDERDEIIYAVSYTHLDVYKRQKGQCTNPYGWTKSMLEQILSDIQKADPEWNVVLLRYFNPIGAHKSGTIGENPNGIPNNLMPYITQVAVGKLKELGVFGNDYDTPDGTGVRDYIHVVDLAKGHVKALKKIEDKSGLSIYNLGTGKGYSVLDIVKNFEEANGVKIPYVIKPRRDVYKRQPQGLLVMLLGLAGLILLLYLYNRQFK